MRHYAEILTSARPNTNRSQSFDHRLSHGVPTSL
jgi:hypothetical protein